jgi:hypothetical protein
MTMSGPALKRFRLLRSLRLPDSIFRKIGIAADGKLIFTALTDEQFDSFQEHLKRAYPKYGSEVVAPILQVPTEPTGPREWGVPPHTQVH